MTGTRLSPAIFLSALSVIFAYATFQYGGVLVRDWDECLVGLGLLVLLYFRFTHKEDLAPRLEPWFRWPLVLLLMFVGFQLIPLPISLLKILSPTRAQLLLSLDGVVPAGGAAPISVFPAATLAHLLRLAAYTVVFVLTRELAWRMKRHRWRIVAPVIVVAAAESVVGLLQYGPSGGSSFAHGTYVNQNHFAGLLELALPFAAAYPMTVLSNERRQDFRHQLLAALSIVVSVLALLGIVLSMSRMGFLASLLSLLIAGMLVLWTYVSRRKRFLVPAVVGTAVVAAFFYIAPEHLIGRFGEVLGSPGITPGGRIQIWRDTLQLIQHYPLVGCGLGAFEPAFLKYKVFAPQFAVTFAHNDYLQLFAELGAMGFTIVTALLMAVFLASARAALATINGEERYLGIACVAALIAILVHSLTDFNLYIPANAMLLSWISGVTASLRLGKRVSTMSATPDQ